MCVLGAIWFDRVRLVHLGAPLGLLGSIGFVKFLLVCLGGRRVHSALFGSFECALGIGLLGCTLWVDGFILVRLVNLCALCGSLGSFGFVWVHP